VAERGGREGEKTCMHVRRRIHPAHVRRRREGEKTFCSRTKGSAKVERNGEGGERKGTWGAGRKRTHSRKWLYTTVIDSFPPARTDSPVQGYRFTV